ncbi:hypothetical protein RKLH11_2690 [Rhodobacteraceae bacterium KLH11]|nr:hypothetical protein RKLH11_2690 [Rhodobacteraceae bacterium KLH11]
MQLPRARNIRMMRPERKPGRATLWITNLQTRPEDWGGQGD